MTGTFAPMLGPRFPLLRFALIALAACSSTGDDKTMPTQKSSTSAATTASDSLTLQQVARLPRPGTVVPTSVAFVGDGSHVSFLFSDDGSLTRQLYALDLSTGERRKLVDASGGGDTESNLSPAEKLERERKREHGLGVTRYSWSNEGDTLMVPLHGALHVQNGLDGELRARVDTTRAPALSPRLSRDGSMLAYVMDQEVYVVDTDGTSEPRQITEGARGTGTMHGLAEYIAQEEMDRYAGFWWSRDGKHMAFTEIDETHIPSYRIMHQGNDSTGREAQEDHGYPFAGAANARVKLGVVPVAGGKTVWLDLGESDDNYLARVHWMPSGEVWAEVENREQSQLDLLAFDPQSGRKRLVLSERSDIWINLHSHFRALTETDEASFLWASERTGFMHLYLYDDAGKEVRALTSGEWPVDSVAGVDEKGRRVFFLSGHGDPTQQQLYEVSFDGGEARRITQEPGTHSVSFSKDFSRFVDTHSSMAQAPQIHVRNTSDDAAIATIYDVADPDLAALDLSPPEMVVLKSRDGTVLHGAIYRPPAHFKGPFPTLVSVYGGPHAQRVADTWAMTVDLGAQHLRDRATWCSSSTTAARPGAAWRSKAPSATTWAMLRSTTRSTGVDGSSTRA